MVSFTLAFTHRWQRLFTHHTYRFFTRIVNLLPYRTTAHHHTRANTGAGVGTLPYTPERSPVWPLLPPRYRLWWTNRLGGGWRIEFTWDITDTPAYPGCTSPHAGDSGAGFYRGRSYLPGSPQRGWRPPTRLAGRFSHGVYDAGTGPLAFCLLHTAWDSSPRCVSLDVVRWVEHRTYHAISPDMWIPILLLFHTTPVLDIAETR